MQEDASDPRADLTLTAAHRLGWRLKSCKMSILCMLAIFVACRADQECRRPTFAPPSPVLGLRFAPKVDRRSGGTKTIWAMTRIAAPVGRCPRGEKLLTLLLSRVRCCVVLLEQTPYRGQS